MDKLRDNIERGRHFANMPSATYVVKETSDNIL